MRPVRPISCFRDVGSQNFNHRQIGVYAEGSYLRSYSQLELNCDAYPLRSFLGIILEFSICQ